MEIPKKNFTEDAKKMAEIRRILCDNSNNTLASRLQLSPSVVSSICAGRKGIGRRTAERILAAFPEVSSSWLLSGEGPMLLASGNVGDNNSGNVATTGGTVITADERLVSLLEQAAAQNTALITIISNLTRHDG